MCRILYRRLFCFEILCSFFWPFYQPFFALVRQLKLTEVFITVPGFISGCISTVCGLLSVTLVFMLSAVPFSTGALSAMPVLHRSSSQQPPLSSGAVEDGFQDCSLCVEMCPWHCSCVSIGTLCHCRCCRYLIVDKDNCFCTRTAISDSISAYTSGQAMVVITNLVQPSFVRTTGMTLPQFVSN